MSTRATLSEFIKRLGLVRLPAGRAAVSWTIVALNFASWFMVAWLYHLPPLKEHNSYLLLRVGAANGDLLLAGEWWRVITSQYLHVYFPHLAFNMAALLFLGAALEPALGSLRFAVLYVVSGSLGQFVGIAATPALVSSGASQAVMGVAGATAIALLRGRVAGAFLSIALLGVVGIQMGLDMLVAGTIKAGHWSGLAAGAGIGYIWNRYPKERSSS